MEMSPLLRENALTPDMWGIITAEMPQRKKQGRQNRLVQDQRSDGAVSGQKHRPIMMGFHEHRK